MTDTKQIKTVQENLSEIERITTIIENHCLCLKLIYKGDTHYEVILSDGFQSGFSHNQTKRLSLIDLAMYLEKVWIHSGIQTKEIKIERVKQFRIENKLEA